MKCSKHLLLTSLLMSSCLSKVRLALATTAQNCDLPNTFLCGFAVSVFLIVSTVVAALAAVSVRFPSKFLNFPYFGEEGLKVSSTVAISEAGEYKVCCWLLENNIKMSQTSQSEAQQWDINNHINVLRAVSDISDIPGQAVTAGANETQTFEWNFSVSDLRNGRPQDSHVLVIISKKEADGTYIVNNVVRCEYKSAVEYEYE